MSNASEKKAARLVKKIVKQEQRAPVGSDIFLPNVSNVTDVVRKDKSSIWGTSGQVLTSNGSTSPPSFQAAGSASLNDGDIFVGNSSNVATGVTMSGDATIDNTGALTIADNAITLAKMAGGTAGNLITFDASGDPAAVATGTAAQVLTSNGAGAAPTFQDAAGGGGTTFVETVTVTNGSSLASTNALGGEAYFVVFGGKGASETVDPRIQINARTTGWEYMLRGTDTETGNNTNGCAMAVDVNPSSVFSGFFTVMLIDDDAGNKLIAINGGGLSANERQNNFIAHNTNTDTSITDIDIVTIGTSTTARMHIYQLNLS